MIIKKFRGLVVTSEGTFTIAVTPSYEQTLNEMQYVRMMGLECYIQEVLEQET